MPCSIQPECSRSGGGEYTLREEVGFDLACRAPSIQPERSCSGIGEQLHEISVQSSVPRASVTLKLNKSHISTPAVRVGLPAGLRQPDKCSRRTVLKVGRQPFTLHTSYLLYGLASQQASASLTNALGAQSGKVGRQRGSPAPLLPLPEVERERSPRLSSTQHEQYNSHS